MFKPPIVFKRVWVPPEEEKEIKEEKPRTIASPVIEGKKFIGSGEDAHVFNEYHNQDNP